jgi:putative transposase
MHWPDRSMRRPTVNEPGHAPELTFSCFHGFPFLKSERTCRWLAEAIDEARAKHDFALWAYVFMPEHVHVLIFPKRPQYDIAVIRKSIKEPVGRKAIKYLRAEAPEWFSRLEVKRGSHIEHRFWQTGGGYDRNAYEPETIWAMIEYIHANPVRRGLVEYAETWKWSSAGWFEGKNTLRPDLVGLGGLFLTRPGKG